MEIYGTAGEWEQKKETLTVAGVTAAADGKANTSRLGIVKTLLRNNAKSRAMHTTEEGYV